MKWNWIFGKKAQASPKKVANVAIVPPGEGRGYASQSFRPGEIIAGEFKVLHSFRGGMGAVYVVEHREFEKPIVLKSFLATNDERARQTFLREAETWIALGTHPNIVQAFWAKQLAGYLFVAAEYIPPDTLGRNTVEHYVRRGNVPLAVVLKWIAQFCHGMAHSNAKGIVAHRDIKPANLMVDALGDLRVTDFGIAKRSSFSIESPSKLTANTNTNTTVAGSGTPPYMPPEQFLPNQQVDHRADIYSFGATLFELCTGRPPFIANSVEGIFLHHLKSPVPATGTALDPIIADCMAKQKEHRFQTYDALLTAARTLADKLGVQLPRDPLVIADHEVLYAQGLSYSAMGNPKKAMECIDKYLRLEPDDYRGWTQKGVLCLTLGDLETGRNATLRSIELNSLNSHAWNNLGLLCSRMKRPLDAVHAFRKAIEIDPYNTGPMLNLTGPLIELGEHQEALASVQGALKLAPQKASLWHNLGGVFAEMMQYEEASKAYEKALSLDPSNEQTRAAIEFVRKAKGRKAEAGELLRAGRVVEATTLLENLVSEGKATVADWHNLGLIYLGSKKTSQAIDCFVRVLEFNPSDEFSLKTLVRIHLESGNIREGRTYVDRLFKVPGGNEKAFWFHVQLLQLEGQEAEAEKLMTELVGKQPQNDLAWLVLGEIHARGGKIQEAVAAYRKCEGILQAVPDQFDNLNLVRESLRALGEVPAKTAAKPTASRSQPKSSSPEFTLFCGGCGAVFNVEGPDTTFSFKLRGVSRFLCAYCRESLRRNAPGIPLLEKGYDKEGQEIHRQNPEAHPREKLKKRQGQREKLLFIKRRAKRTGEVFPPLIFRDEEDSVPQAPVKLTGLEARRREARRDCREVYTSDELRHTTKDIELRISDGVSGMHWEDRAKPFNKLVSTLIKANTVENQSVNVSVSELGLEGLNQPTHVRVSYKGTHHGGNTTVSLIGGTSPLVEGLNAKKHFEGFFSAFFLVWGAPHVGARDHGFYEVPSQFFFNDEQLFAHLLKVEQKKSDDPSLSEVLTIPSGFRIRDVGETRFACLGQIVNEGVYDFWIKVRGDGRVSSGKALILKTQVKTFF